MKATIEREDFSERLRQALQNAEYSAESPTQLAREFNIRFTGHPITVHAARKWLVGEAIPTQEKLRTLAQWLNVPTEWLRFGGDQRQGERRASAGAPDAAVRFESEDLKLIADLQRLDKRSRLIAREMIRMLARMDRCK
ncbi:MAG TPA: hypothetical protein VHK70_06855 [Burkholderiaceae bacterium]|jgi:transcriptional regulator with XRE-family HTH domain|nr:hypothetical protein [Burkholderiaceae bacterium]